MGFNASQPVKAEITQHGILRRAGGAAAQGHPGDQGAGPGAGLSLSDYNLSESADTYKAALKWDPVGVAVGARVRTTARSVLPNINWSCSCRSRKTSRSTPTPATPQAHSAPARARRRSSHCAQRAGHSELAFLAGFAQPNAAAQAIVGGNPNLDPETADTITAGRGVEPERRERLGQQPAGVGSTTSITEHRGRHLVTHVELDHRPLLQSAERESDVRSQQLSSASCSAAIRTISASQGIQTTTAEPVRAQSHRRGPARLTGKFRWGDNGNALGFKLLATHTIVEWNSRRPRRIRSSQREGTIVADRGERVPGMEGRADYQLQHRRASCSVTTCAGSMRCAR